MSSTGSATPHRADVTVGDRPGLEIRFRHPRRPIGVLVIVIVVAALLLAVVTAGWHGLAGVLALVPLAGWPAGRCLSARRLVHVARLVTEPEGPSWTIEAGGEGPQRAALDAAWCPAARFAALAWRLADGRCVQALVVGTALDAAGWRRLRTTLRLSL